MATALLFLATALAEIGGCWLVWAWLRGGRSAWLLLPAAASLALFAWLLTLHPTAAGRVYAAYGGVYVAVALLWLWAVDGVRPTRWDLLGAVLCLAGMAVIMFAPRGLGGIVISHVQLARQGRLAPLTVPYLIGGVGTVLATSALVLVVEVAGRVMADEYEVLKLSTQQAWPAVEVWGSQWAPFGLKTLATVVMLGALGAALLRVAVKQVRQVFEGPEGLKPCMH